MNSASGHREDHKDTNIVGVLLWISFVERNFFEKIF